MRKCLIVPAVILIMIAACSTHQPELQPIRIGGLFPITGDRAEYGLRAQQGMLLAVTKINAEGGIEFGGQRLLVQAVVADSGGPADRAVQELDRLIDNDKVAGVIGPLDDDIAFTLAPIAEDRQVPVISPTAAGDGPAAVGRFLFRACLKRRDLCRAARSYGSRVYGSIGQAPEDACDVTSRSALPPYAALGGIWMDTKSEEGHFVLAVDFYAGEQRPETIRFVSDYREQYGSEPEYYAALTYDATRLMLDAIGRAGSLNGQDIQRALLQTEIAGVTGPIKFDAEGNARKEVAILDVKEGVPTFIERMPVQ